MDSFYSLQAAKFKKDADDIERRLENEGSTLDPDTYNSLIASQHGLLNQAAEMVVNDLKGTLDGLKTVDRPRVDKSTDYLNDAINKVKEFNKAVAIADAALNLAIAINSAQPGAVLDALQQAETAVKETPGKSNVVRMQPLKVTDTADKGLTIAAAARSDKPRKPRRRK